MNEKSIIHMGRHEGWLGMVSKGVKDGRPWAFDKAAQLFKIMIPDNGVVCLVPMPSHFGYAKSMLDVCHLVKKYRRDETIVMDILECEPHESNYEQKKRGEYPRPIKMTAKECLEFGCVIILDNCVGTGVTARAALDAIGVSDAMVMTITKGS